jgi:hypothetical protein
MAPRMRGILRIFAALFFAVVVIIFCWREKANQSDQGDKDV